MDTAGGTSPDLLKLVFAEGMRTLAIGLAIGLPCGIRRDARPANRANRVSPGDPVTFIGVVLVLILAGALGCAVPARKAIHIDPVAALQWD
jgi:putative ABC transport system permease protein